MAVRPGSTRQPEARWGLSAGAGLARTRSAISVRDSSTRFRSRDKVGFFRFAIVTTPRLRLALGCLFPALLDPLGIGHLPARRQPAHPGAMRTLGKVHRNAQLARSNGQSVDVVHVLVGDKMASSVSGSSPASRMRRNSSRQLNPASTRMRVRPPETTVQLPLEPEASTVKRTML